MKSPQPDLHLPPWTCHNSSTSRPSPRLITNRLHHPAMVRPWTAPHTDRPISLSVHATVELNP